MIDIQLLISKLRDKFEIIVEDVIRNKLIIKSPLNVFIIRIVVLPSSHNEFKFNVYDLTDRLLQEVNIRLVREDTNLSLSAEDSCDIIIMVINSVFIGQSETIYIKTHDSHLT